MSIEDSSQKIPMESSDINNIMGNVNNQSQLDPKKLFDLVSKNYNTWSHVINKQFEDEENFSPFPNEDGGIDENSKPIFNYSLLEALDKASNDFSNKILEEQVEANTEKIKENKAEDEFRKEEQRTNKQGKPADQINKVNMPLESFLKESEIDFLRSKISQMISANDFTLKTSPRIHYKRKEGFSLYDTEDEEGLHEGNTDNYDDNQDDYDLEEIRDEDFSYSYPPSHHIEVELNTTPECDQHGTKDCKCPIYESSLGGGYSDNGPSCEFTFEYDRNGKLIPTYSNVEEKIRLMKLQSSMANVHESMNSSDILPPINELQIRNRESDKKSKKKNKKKGKNVNNVNPVPDDTHSTVSYCLFCEYEAVYGKRPHQMIKWYNQRIKKDELRREEIKKKLENAKSKALRKQRELRQRQHEQLTNSIHTSDHLPRNHDIIEPETSQDTFSRKQDQHGTTLQNELPYTSP